MATPKIKSSVISEPKLTLASELEKTYLGHCVPTKGIGTWAEPGRACTFLLKIGLRQNYKIFFESRWDFKNDKFLG